MLQQSYDKVTLQLCSLRHVQNVPNVFAVFMRPMGIWFVQIWDREGTAQVPGLNQEVQCMGMHGSVFLFVYMR